MPARPPIGNLVSRTDRLCRYYMEMSAEKTIGHKPMEEVKVRLINATRPYGKGNRVDVKGNRVDVKGNRVDVKGNR
eukprot:474013-Pyramimonas_sp.AAC.1